MLNFQKVLRLNHDRNLQIYPFLSGKVSLLCPLGRHLQAVVMTTKSRDGLRNITQLAVMSLV